MATYVIGDVQGCYDELMALLEKICFDPNKDKLWFTGDLVNRGPKSLAVLRFVKGLGDHHQMILGNHDLHLLALFYGVKNRHTGDTLDDILQAEDKEELIDWLRYRNLLYYDDTLQIVMTHAGIAPAWDLQQAKQLAKEVEQALRKTPLFFLENMYGKDPDKWDDNLSGVDRLRCITNYFTRMRFCYQDGRLDLSYKGKMHDKPAYLMPWFQVPSRATANINIIFGHWAALNGVTNTPHVYAVDTGCVWGNCLTAMRLDDAKRFTVKC